MNHPGFPEALFLEKICVMGRPSSVSNHPVRPNGFLNIQSAVYNTFYLQRHLCDGLTFKRLRADVFNVWETASAAT